MNEKDNETSQDSGVEPEKLGSGPIPEKEEDLPEEEPVVASDEESITTSDKEPEEDIEVSPETPLEEELVESSDEDLVTSSDKEPEEDIEVSPETPLEEESVESSDEDLVTSSDKEPEEDIEVSPETPLEEELVESSDEETMAVSDKEPDEDIEVSPKTPLEEEQVVAFDEESAAASDKEPEEEVEVVPEIPVKEEIPVKKEPETPPEPAPVIKEETKEAPPKEVVIIKEVEKKPNKFVRKIKRTALVIVLVIALALAGTMYAWTSGMDDLRDDNTYLIVVVYKDVPHAASIYHTDTKQSDVIEVTELGALSNNKQFYENVQKQHNVLIDRLIIIDIETFRKLSTEEYIIYDETDERIDVDEMCSWIIGTGYPPEEVQLNDTPSKVKAKILKSWIDHYSDKLISGYGGYSARVILNAYRSDKIVIYPGNSALMIMKYVAVERIFIPLD